jgi:hypothetical protein
MRNEVATVPLRAVFANPHAKASEYIWETVEKLDAIEAAISQIIAIQSKQVALVTITLHYEDEEKAGARRGLHIISRTQTHQGTAYLLSQLRPLVRRTDHVFLLGHSLFFVLPGATIAGGQIVRERLWEALLWQTHNMTDSGMVRPHSMTGGHSAYPVPVSSIDGLINIASSVSMRFDTQLKRPVSRHNRLRDDRLACLAPAPQRRRSTELIQASQEKPGRVEQRQDDEELPRLARKLGIPYLSLLPQKPPQRVQRLMDAKLAQELQCYPLGRERNVLTVAMVDPQDHSALDRLRRETGMHIFPVLTHPDALESALAQLV